MVSYQQSAEPETPLTEGSELDDDFGSPIERFSNSETLNTPSLHDKTDTPDVTAETKLPDPIGDLGSPGIEHNFGSDRDVSLLNHSREEKGYLDSDWRRYASKFSRRGSSNPSWPAQGDVEYPSPDPKQSGSCKGTSITI